jgi:phosphatidylserine decarboxylase
MLIDRAGLPFILVALALAAAAAWGGGRAWSVPFLVLAAFFVFFFRDPDRTTPVDPNLVVSPADGRVMIAGDRPGPGAPKGEWRQISIFLSPMDVHVNRMPIGGRVTKVTYKPGRFLPAYKDQAADLNVFTEVVLDHDGMTVVVRQIVGILARRIVCRVKEGEVVQTGARFGVMKFGSRMDVFLPKGSMLHVTVGDKVRGGITRLATLPAAAEGAAARELASTSV